METQKYIKINPADTVVVCLTPMAKGEVVSVDDKEVALLQDVPAGHKILIEDTRAGANIIKYGYPIGHAAEDLVAGQWVNEHNLKTNLSGTLSYEYHPVSEVLAQPAAPSAEPTGATFMGYVRKNGEVGIRNEIWIVPTVGCVNGIAERLARQLQSEINASLHDCHTESSPSCGELEGGTPIRVHAWHHNFGCSQLSGDHENTRKILRDIVLHPNAGAVLVLGLGCENNQPEAFMQTLGNYDRDRIRLLVTQQVEGDETEAAMGILRELYQIVKGDRRTACPISRLRIGLKCGGSDGLSGITANPLVGAFSDYLVERGGTTILTEVPEMFGAETILMNRCRTRELFDQTVSLINDFKEYFLSHGEPVGENPSPGNKAGGISTLEDKALGCTQKCGKALVSGVLAYGDRLQTDGLNLLSAPGNDLVAATALAAAGCQMVLFTTGRGTPFGTFIPTMKIATNSTLFQRKPNWIDFNAGRLAEGTPMDDLLSDFVAKVVSVANGEPTRNEANGYSEIAIFKNGVTL